MTNVASADENEPRTAKETPSIGLQIGLTVDSPKVSLAFTITNRTQKDFRTSIFGGTWNRIVIVKPDGGEAEIYEKIMELEPNIIKASNSKTEFVNLSEFLELPVVKGHFKEPGSYSIYWKLRDISTDDATFLKSNRIIFLKSKGN
jgi:hypothetical protein